VVCGCSTVPGDSECAIDAFAAARLRCPAIRQLLIPDDLWPRFEQWHRGPLDDARHQSVLVLAMQCGHLERFVSPVHRYLLLGDEVRAEVVSQYRQDLRESWMMSADLRRRHDKVRGFVGRIAELQVAEWLEAQGWFVASMEALGGTVDIEARSPHGSIGSGIEVKYIGVEVQDFDRIVASLAAGAKAGVSAVSPYDAANYLLVRVYEAAVQLLRRFDGHRIVVVVVQDMTWRRFDVQLQNGWIDWKAPRLFQANDGHAFLKCVSERYAAFPGDLAEVVRSIDEILVLRQLSDGRLCKVERIVLRGNQV
jgi:hypothetical protein